MGITTIYEPKATGSTTSRDIRDRFSDIVNVKDYGAKGDGTTTDDAAFTAAAATGKAVFVPGGTYKVTSSISGTFFGPDYVSITGGGSINFKEMCLVENSAAAHNSIYRGKDLTNVYTLDQISSKLAAGDFSDLYIGDYITKNFSISYSGVPSNNSDGDTITASVSNVAFNFRIAHFNYWMYMGDSTTTNYVNKNHIVFVPDKPFFNVKMRKTNTTEGGIPASNGWFLCQNAVYTSICNIFGTSHILVHRDCIPGTVNTTYASMAGNGYTGSTIYESNNWWRDVKINMMHEPMVYGTTVCSSSCRDTGCGKSQLALFRLDPTWIHCGANRSSFWLCAVSASSNFAYAYGGGDAGTNNASISNGVRPYILFA